MINGNTVKGMIEHWLSTPPNGYFGQPYGADIRSMLLNELSADNADLLLVKLRQDIPLLGRLSDSQLSIETQTRDNDKLYVYLRIGGVPFEIGEAKTGTTGQEDFYNVRAQ